MHNQNLPHRDITSVETAGGGGSLVSMPLSEFDGMRDEIKELKEKIKREYTSNEKHGELKEKFDAQEKVLIKERRENGVIFIETEKTWSRDPYGFSGEVKYLGPDEALIKLSEKIKEDRKKYRDGMSKKNKELGDMKSEYEEDIKLVGEKFDAKNKTSREWNERFDQIDRDLKEGTKELESANEIMGDQRNTIENITKSNMRLEEKIIDLNLKLAKAKEKKPFKLSDWIKFK